MTTLLALYVLLAIPVALVYRLTVGPARPDHGPLAPEELARRVPVWCALSDLFLDTDPQIFGDSIHAALRRSGYGRAEILAILEWEVAPVVGPNLFSVAGEWVGFPEDWLVERILAMRRARGAGVRWLGGALALPAARRDLAAIERTWGRLPERGVSR